MVNSVKSAIYILLGYADPAEKQEFCIRLMSLFYAAAKYRIKRNVV